MKTIAATSVVFTFMIALIRGRGDVANRFNSERKRRRSLEDQRLVTPELRFGPFSTFS